MIRSEINSLSKSTIWTTVQKQVNCLPLDGTIQGNFRKPCIMLFKLIVKLQDMLSGDEDMIKSVPFLKLVCHFRSR